MISSTLLPQEKGKNTDISECANKWGSNKKLKSLLEQLLSNNSIVNWIQGKRFINVNYIAMNKYSLKSTSSQGVKELIMNILQKNCTFQ